MRQRAWLLGFALLTCDSEEGEGVDDTATTAEMNLTLPEQAAIEAANALAEHRHPPGLSLVERGFPPMEGDCPGNGNGNGCGNGGGNNGNAGGQP